DRLPGDAQPHRLAAGVADQRRRRRGGRAQKRPPVHAVSRVSRLISGRAATRTGSPTVPSPRVTYSWGYGVRTSPAKYFDPYLDDTRYAPHCGTHTVPPCAAPLST